MKKVILFIGFIFLLISCENYFEGSCVCTCEFVTITVSIVDNNNRPIKGLNIELIDKDGVTYKIEDELNYFIDSYVVFSDGYMKLLGIVPEIFFVKAYNDSINIIEPYSFGKDKCNCHVYKVSGKDTLYVN